MVNKSCLSGGVAPVCCVPQVVKLLVGNKVDKERVVTRAQAEEYARSKGMLFLEARCVRPILQWKKKNTGQMICMIYSHYSS